MPGAARILVVFKTHLDIGFTAVASEVVRGYRERWIPRALGTARELRLSGGPDRFVWTTGSWLVDDYLENAGRRGRRLMEEAIGAGDIVWHALPFTMHSELLDEGLFEFGLSISAGLDRRFGRRTIAAKMTDVPGHTRSVVPLLAQAGVRFLHLGVNPATPVPAVPPVFRWAAPGGGSLVVAYSGDYGRPVRVRGLGVELHFAHTGDNHGPQDGAAVRAVLAGLRAAASGTRVAAGTLDAFARALGPVADSLPVVTSEIGDTWIHGVASDPAKTAAYRELLEFRRRTLRRRPALARSRSFRRFSSSLLLVPEHTWGRDTKVGTRLPDGSWVFGSPGRWDRAGFRMDRARGLFSEWERSWDEQRAYLREAVAALEPASLRAQARRAVRACLPRCPALARAAPLSPRRLEAAGHALAFDARGALVRWRTPEGRELAGARHPLGLFSYQVFSPRECERWYRTYTINHEATSTWSRPDFTKSGYERLAGAGGGRWHPRLADLRLDTSGDVPRVVALLECPREAVRRFGCPPGISVEWTLPGPLRPLGIRLQLFGKPACRIPEAGWFTFRADVARPRDWRLVKLGGLVDPRDVVRLGNRHLHAMERAVHPSLALVSRHAPVVALGKATLLEFLQDRPEPGDGLHVNLFNNVWGGNFVQWTEGDMRFDFELHA
jgi:Domain of unknown function (DUF5054)